MSDWNDTDWDNEGGSSYNDGRDNDQQRSYSSWRDDNESGNSRNFNNRRGGGYRRSNEQRNSWRDDRRNDQSNFKDNSNAIEMYVPSRCVGRIIGLKGSKITEIQNESGARVQITKETNGDETLVKIFGGGENVVEKAKDLINALTSSEHPRQDGYRNREQSHYSNRTENREQHSGNNFYTDAPPSTQQWNAQSAVIDWNALLKESEENAQKEWGKLPPIQKQFYREHPEVTAMSDAEVEQLRTDNNNIVVERTFQKEDSRPIPKPVVTFEHAFASYPGIMNEIVKAGFQNPTPIQRQAWPVLLSGEDLIGIAQTGTGKTLAFLLPAFIHIDGQLSKRDNREGPAVLIMAPTRELALQIEKEAKKYEYKGISAVCIYGGGNRKEQIQTCLSGIDIVIATPGRLNDLVAAGFLNVKYVTYVVLDEADRMLDMGFEPQIRKVMYSIRPTRQTVMTSATWPPGVRRLAQSYMNDPIQVYVGSLDLAATHTVTQIIELVPDDEFKTKFDMILQFAQNLNPTDKAIVFCGKKARADELSAELCLAGLDVQTIHGDREQSDREQALKDIADGSVQMLIATDVASRGLDIDDITHVINFDFPKNVEEYVHRVGRTGRAGKSGQSISYVTRNDWAQAKELIAILEEAQQYVPDELYQMADRYAAWKSKKDADRRTHGGDRRSHFGGGGGGGRNKW